MKLQSSAFADGADIPSRYTCHGLDVSPPLTWEDLPSGTRSLALIVEDPDAPGKIWTHWVIFDVPPEPARLNEHVPTSRTLSNGARQGLNDFGHIGYGGPCPPSGTHRYFFKLYALNTAIALSPGVTKEQLLKAMTGHVLGEGELMGRAQQ